MLKIIHVCVVINHFVSCVEVLNFSRLLDSLYYHDILFQKERKNSTIIENVLRGALH